MSPPAGTERSVFVPMLLGLAALGLWLGFQSSELVRERYSLAEAHDRQTASLEQAYKIRQGADSLAAKTQQLADAGNANAQVVVTNLRQRGVSINPSAKSLSPPP